MSTIVVMPGGFHPFHAGHAALYNSARRAFPDAEVFVAATNDTSTRPFPFAIKEKLAKLAGVEPGHFVQVKSPFQAKEITAGFNPEVDKLIFVRSEKDAGKPPQAGGVKKDGTPSYLQPLLGAKKLEPFGKRAYMAYLPTVEFGPGMTSATEIRTAWPQLNEKRKTALVMSLYPATQTNPKLAANVVKLLDTAIGGELAEGVELKFHTIELAESQIKAYAKQYFECYNIELPHGKFINNVGRFGSKKLTESSEANEIAPFIQMIKSVDSPKTIKVGDYFSVLAFEINFAWKEIYGLGFTTPKEVVDVKMHSNGTISYIEFADGDRYPRLTPATYQGKPIVQTAYFDRAGAASSSLTALALKVPDGWDFNTADVEQDLDEGFFGLGGPAVGAPIASTSEYNRLGGASKLRHDAHVALKMVDSLKHTNRDGYYDEEIKKYLKQAQEYLAKAKEIEQGQQLDEFAPDGFNGGDDGEEFNPKLAKMAYEAGFVKGVSLTDAATTQRAMAINDWDKHDGGIYAQHFAKGFIEGRKEKIRHDNKQYNLNLQLNKDGSVSHGEQGLDEGVVYNTLNIDNQNLIDQKAKSKPDGLYTFRGIMFRVRNGRVTHYAAEGTILVSYGNFNSAVGSYSTRDEAKAKLKSIKEGVEEAYDHNAPFNAADFQRHMAQLRAREELRKTDPMKALVGDMIDKDNAARAVKKKPEDDSIGINDPRHPGYAYTQMGQTNVDEGEEEALAYATKAHAGQTRSGGDPYITHPMRVADHIRKYKQSHNLDALISAAYLHDTIEDTDTTQEALHDLFGGLVASLVKELTSDPEEIKRVGKAQYLAHKMAAMSSYGLVIKLADRLDNVKDITTAKTPQWRAKYAAETNQILDYIEKTRALSGTHNKLISLIRAKLAEIDNPQAGVTETLAGVSPQGFVGGMYANYQARENQPTNEDYLDE